jgi:dihydropteroate synthase
MGVINLTPDSFSDGGTFTNPQKIENEIKTWQNQGHFCFDFGAESTAPKNRPITLIQEQQRLIDLFFPLLKKNIFNPAKTILSLDTYRFETIEMVMKEFPEYQWLWNDVSGKWDASVDDFLQRYPNAYYIYSHNLAPHRSLSAQHNEYVPDLLPAAYLEQIKKYFIAAKQKNCSQVIFDPCFGFAKNTDHNWYLWDHLSELMSEVNHSAWLVGISRKRFLRERGIDDLAQKQMIFDKKDQLGAQENVIWRVHDLQNYNSF